MRDKMSVEWQQKIEEMRNRAGISITLMEFISAVNRLKQSRARSEKFRAAGVMIPEFPTRRDLDKIIWMSAGFHDTDSVLSKWVLETDMKEPDRIYLTLLQNRFADSRLGICAVKVLSPQLMRMAGFRRISKDNEPECWYYHNAASIDARISLTILVQGPKFDVELRDDALMQRYELSKELRKASESGSPYPQAVLWNVRVCLSSLEKSGVVILKKT